MSIYYCMECGHDSTNIRTFSKHIRDHHFRYSREYYDLHLRKEGDGSCLDCGKDTKFVGLSEGYRETCGNRCACIVHRRNLKENIAKFNSFKIKVATNQKAIWASREETGEKDTIILKVKNSVCEFQSTMTQQERVEMFSRYHKCDEETIDRLNRRGSEQLMRLKEAGMNGYAKTLKGRFSPKNPQKYKGDPTNIIFRSSYELHVMKYFDTTSAIIEWSSEEVVVPYISPKDNKRHRYFPDFLVKVRQGDQIKTLLIEVKPAKETREPIKKKRITKQYVNEVLTWAINSAKWQMAEEYAKDRGWEFKILTEAEIFGKKTNK